MKPLFVKLHGFLLLNSPKVFHLSLSLSLADIIFLIEYPFSDYDGFFLFQVYEFTDDYEYVDVMMKDNNLLKVTRLIVDMDFKSQFELARPSPSYKELKDILPDIFVGTEEKLDKVISLVCSAAKKSLKKMGLHVPPWRKAPYMQSKWLSKDCKKISISPTNMELGIISQMH